MACEVRRIRESGLPIHAGHAGDDQKNDDANDDQDDDCHHKKNGTKTVQKSQQRALCCGALVDTSTGLTGNFHSIAAGHRGARPDFGAAPLRSSNESTTHHGRKYDGTDTELALVGRQKRTAPQNADDKPHKSRRCKTGH